MGNKLDAPEKQTVARGRSGGYRVGAQEQTMRFSHLASSIACALAIFVSDNASALDAIQLYRDCHAKTGSVGDFGCIAYIHGFLDGIATGRVVAEKMPRMFCPPKEGVSVDKGRLIIEKYIRDHPGELNHAARLVAAGAMYDAFPCR